MPERPTWTAASFRGRHLVGVWGTERTPDLGDWRMHADYMVLLTSRTIEVNVSDKLGTIRRLGASGDGSQIGDQKPDDGIIMRQQISWARHVYQ